MEATQTAPATWSKPEKTEQAKGDQPTREFSSSIHLSGTLERVIFKDSTKKEGEQYALARLKTKEPDWTKDGVTKPGKEHGYSILVNNSGIAALKQLVAGVTLDEKGAVPEGERIELTVNGYLKDKGRGEAEIAISRVTPGLEGELNKAVVRGEVLKAKIVGKDSFRAVELEVETASEQRFFGKIYAKDDCDKVLETFGRGKHVEFEGKFVATGTQEHGFTNSISVSTIKEVQRALDVDNSGPERDEGPEIG